jgi:phospholipid/cholesterol/gamma-HCH transport system substrate-binding protein
MRRHRSRISNLAAGVIAIVVIFAACYLVFGGSLPFSGSPFVLKAVFTSQTQLHIPSPVRVAGVDVGQVVSVKRVSDSSDAAVITMHINEDGLPIHADANAKVRPRIFLEGNFYVDLSPGTPDAPSLKSGSTLSAAHNAGPVQLDRVLASLTSNARRNLQTLLQGIGSSLNGRPTPTEDATQDPSVRGLTGGEALNKSLDYSAGAFRASAIVNQALLGEQPGDLTKAIQGNERVLKGFADSGPALASLVHTFNSTMATLASRQQDLERTIELLPPTLRRVNSADSALDRSFGPTQQFARDILPGVKELGPTIGAAIPWIKQAETLVSPQQLGGLLKNLTPAVQNTGATIPSTKALLSSANVLARCFNHNLIPTGNERIQDPPDTTGLHLYQELFQSAVGIAGASGNFDGNGRYVRSSAGGGANQVQTPSIPNLGPFYGNAVLPVLGTRPAYTTAPPPIRRDIACYKNEAPNLNAARTGAGQ